VTSPGFLLRRLGSAESLGAASPNITLVTHLFFFGTLVRHDNCHTLLAP
jgi:hypothetical protein